MEYRREIDGLRAVAVLPVILFHAGFSWFSGGYVGVDVFFVISGYLITTILLTDLERGSFSIAKFYERRARRILPALFFVMLCCIPLAWMWMLPSQFKDFSQALIAISFFVSNVLFWQKSGYFAPAAEENPLLHTWSLAVEEQFYIVFPIMLLLLWRFGRRSVFHTVILLSAISFLAAELGWRVEPNATFYLLHSRAWELGVGAACAFLLHDRPQRTNSALAALGLALIIYSVIAYDALTPFPSIYALAPVGGTALVILYGSSSTLTARLLSTKFMVGVGLISFSAYLWHQPLLAFARILSLSHPEWEIMLLLSVASLGLAYLTWRFIEQPFRRKGIGALPSRKAIFTAASLGSIGFIAFGFYGHASDGRFGPWSRQNPELAATYVLLENTVKEKLDGPDLGECQFITVDFEDENLEKIRRCRDTHGSGIAIIGDSHAIDLFNGMVLEDQGEFIVGVVGGGCRAHTPAPECPYENFEALVETYPDVFEKVMYTQAGFYLIMKDGYYTDDPIAGREIFSNYDIDSDLDVSAYQSNEAFISSVEDYLARIAENTEVVWLGPRIEPHISNRLILSKGCDGRFTLRGGQEEIFENLDRDIGERIEASRVRYISQISSYDFNIADDFINCSVWYWSDSDHWSLPGAAKFTRKIMENTPSV